MHEKRPSTHKTRIPPAVKNLQINFCKDPRCPNFGYPPLESIKNKILSTSTATPAPGKKRSKDSYSIDYKDKGCPLIVCHECGGKPPMKSNLAAMEEFERMWAYLEPKEGVSCPDERCPNHGKEINGKTKGYFSIGTTKAGSKRYRCLTCGKTFSVKQKSILRQVKSYENKQIFMLLVNKEPFNRILEVADIGSYTLYSRINFLHRQCLAFAGKIERKFQEKKLGRLYISVDRQEYTVNWTEARDKRNIRLHAITSADNRTGYIFGMHLNFDPRYDSVQVEEDAKACGDYDAHYPFRKYSRLWLANDYKEARENAKPLKKEKKRSLIGRIADGYEDACERDDIEVFETHTTATRLPTKGMLVHAEYTIYGHFLFLHRLLAGAKKIRFFMEQESSMRAACFVAFHKEVQEKRCDAFYVRINKDMTVNEKRRAVEIGRQELELFRHSNQHYEELSDDSLRVLLMEQRIKDGELITFPPFKDRYMHFPAPSMDEPEKVVCYLSALDADPYTPFHLAKLYSRASLHGVGSYFGLVRRRISILERPIATSSNAGRRWSGYSPYDPEMIIKMLDILRVYHNFVKVTKRKIGKDKKIIEKKTPAMRLGIIDRPIKLEEII